MEDGNILVLTSPDGRGVRASVQVARVGRLTDLGVPKAAGSDLGSGSVVVVRTTAHLLQVSRRDGGLRHQFGVLEGKEGSFGAIFILADQELHLVAMDMHAPEVRALLAEAREHRRLRVLMLDPTGDMRLMVPPVSDDVLALFAKVRHSEKRDPVSFIRDLGQALSYSISGEVLEQLHLDPEDIQEVHISCVVAEEIFTNLGRLIRASYTLH